MREDLLSIASDIVEQARKLGADEVDAYVASSAETSARVRMAKVERIIDATSHAASVRVIKDKRTAVCSTVDLTPKALSALVQQALELATIAEPDEHAGLPDRDELALDVQPNLKLYDERIESLSIEEMKDAALRCEQAAFDYDSKVTNSDGAEMGVTRGVVALANSLGFAASYPSTNAMIVVEAICDDEDGKKRNDSWYTIERALHNLEDAEDVGRKAAARAVAKLGARKMETTTLPVVWEAPIVRALLALIGQAASGELLYRRSTFLAGLEGQQVGSSLFSLVDDPLLGGRLGSRPFDGEGVRSRTVSLFEGGTFNEFLFDSYTARRMGRKTTGAAERTLSAPPSPGTSNLMLPPGEQPAEALIEGVEDGLLLTDLMGFGVNMTTGDFSRGAQGFRIEHGKVTYPVTEINVSGNLKDMLASIDAVGDDVQWLGSMAAPSIRMSQLTISGV
ncbi:MAG: TldD/PmbA family protein [Chloroflexi bacterium]|nr:TldD/PmbA family protein [Chloroflexota bacterium]